MPSRPDRPGSGRASVERAARLISLGLIAFLIAHAIHSLGGRPSLRAEGADVGDALVRWSTNTIPGRVHVALDSVPSPRERDWLAALARVGTEIGWDGDLPVPSAISVEPEVDPQHASKVWVAAPAGARIELNDDLGHVDGATVEGSGSVFVLPRVEGRVQASIDSQEVATNDLRDSVSIRSALVVGVAGWEGKFIAAALEEHGWGVDVRFAVAPSGDVEQGTGAIRLDTARYSFVVATDSVIARYADQLAAYVRQQGGGLIVVGEASAVPELAQMLPARMGLPSRPIDFRPETAPRGSLALGELYDWKPGASVLESREDEAAVVAWRVGEGRVIQVGYFDTWRWRMAGLGDDAVENHRLWWSALASGVAYAPRFARQVSDRLEPTPLVSIMDGIGVPGPAYIELRGLLDDPRLLPATFGVILALLFLEWMSRRLRGAR